MKNFLVAVVLLFAQVSLACGSEEVLKITLAKGVEKLEEIKVESATRTIKILDTDGYTNLIMMTPITKKMSDEQIPSLQPIFVSSLKKAIAYYERELEIDNLLIVHPATNQTNISEAKERVALYAQLLSASRPLLTDVLQNGLTRENFRTLFSKVFKNRAPDNIYSILENGVFVEQRETSLLNILGKDVLTSIVNTAYGLSPRGCGVSGEWIR